MDELVPVNPTPFDMTAFEAWLSTLPEDTLFERESPYCCPVGRFSGWGVGPVACTLISETVKVHKTPVWVQNYIGYFDNMSDGRLESAALALKLVKHDLRR